MLFIGHKICIAYVMALTFLVLLPRHHPWFKFAFTLYLRLDI